MATTQLTTIWGKIYNHRMVTQQGQDLISTCLIGDNPITEVNVDAVLPIYSIAKTLIASAIVQLKISPKRTIHDWISQADCPHDINVGQLLNHTSGLRDYGALPEYQKAIQSGTLWSDEDFAEHTVMQPLLFVPGAQFAYSNPGYWLLKRVIEIETGQSLASALDRLIFKPNEMHATYVASGQFSERLPEYPAEWVWHGLVMSTASDIAKFLHAQDPVPLLINFVGVQQAPSPWVNPHYGNGVMVEPEQWYGHNGGGPGYSASAFHFSQSGVTGCVLREVSHVDADNADPAMTDLFNHARLIGAL